LLRLTIVVNKDISECNEQAKMNEEVCSLLDDIYFSRPLDLTHTPRISNITPLAM
jgi:hypothetical protein